MSIALACPTSGIVRLYSHTAIFALTVLLVVLQPSVAGAQTLYAVTRGTTGAPVLLTVNTISGTGTQVGALNPAGTYIGLGFRGSSLYVADDQANTIQQINPTTAAPIGAGLTFVPPINFQGDGDIAFRSDGIGFLADAGGGQHRLFSFDITLSSSALLNNTLPATMDGCSRPGIKDFRGKRDVVRSDRSELPVLALAKRRILSWHRGC